MASASLDTSLSTIQAVLFGGAASKRHSHHPPQPSRPHRIACVAVAAGAGVGASAASAARPSPLAPATAVNAAAQPPAPLLTAAARTAQPHRAAWSQALEESWAAGQVSFSVDDTMEQDSAWLPRTTTAAHRGYPGSNLYTNADLPLFTLHDTAPVVMETKNLQQPPVRKALGLRQPIVSSASSVSAKGTEGRSAAHSVAAAAAVAATARRAATPASPYLPSRAPTRNRIRSNDWQPAPPPRRSVAGPEDENGIRLAATAEARLQTAAEENGENAGNDHAKHASTSCALDAVQCKTVQPAVRRRVLPVLPVTVTVAVEADAVSTKPEAVPVEPEALAAKPETLAAAPNPAIATASTGSCPAAQHSSIAPSWQAPNASAAPSSNSSAAVPLPPAPISFTRVEQTIAMHNGGLGVTVTSCNGAGQGIMVYMVSSTGPSSGRLFPGDVIRAVCLQDGKS